LVFFNSGSDEVSHVGIIISEKGEPLKMIHASTSKGVIIADIESSDYWMKKLHGFGTFLNK
jgi:cell wall-associated NlpC family hydrolase